MDRHPFVRKRVFFPDWNVTSGLERILLTIEEIIAKNIAYCLGNGKVKLIKKVRIDFQNTKTNCT